MSPARRFLVRCVLLGALAPALACSPTSDDSRPSASEPTTAEAFEAGTTVEETLRQHRALPDPSEAIWWRATGRDMAWNNKNLHQIAPTVNVHRAGPVRELARRPDERLAAFGVEAEGGSMSFEDLLESDLSATMGIVILRRGEIAFERYPRMQSHEKPIWWSVTKAFVATLVGILEDRGQVDVSLPVERYVPALEGSDFEGVTVRDILDMASGVDCPDGDYTDTTTCYMQFEASLGDAERDESSPDNPYDFLADLQVGRWAEPGTGFDYSGTNTFVLSWLVEEVTGMPFQDALSREVWTRAGMEGDASIYAGRLGVPLTSGGLLARVRDVARFGLLFTPSYGVVADERIVSEHHVELLLHGGDPELLRKARYGDALSDGVRHNVYQWDLVFSNGDIYKGGWAGQGLLINPERDVVAAWVGYSKDAGSTKVDLLPILRTVLDGVYGDS